MSIREARSQLALLRSKHSARNDHSAELKAFGEEIARSTAQASAKDLAQWLWLEQELAFLLNYRARQWRLLDELGKMKDADPIRIAKSRMGLLILWGREEAADAPKLPYKEFRERAKNLVGSLPPEAVTGTWTSLLFAADLPHLLPEFHTEKCAESALIELWDECVHLTLKLDGDRERLTVVTNQILESDGPVAANLIYAFLGSLYLHSRQAVTEALAYPALGSIPPPSVAMPAEIVQRMIATFSPRQMSVAFDYLSKQYFNEIFLTPYVSDEETKRMVAQYKYHFLSQNSLISCPQVIHWLRLATSRFEFWDDAAERQLALSEAQKLLALGDQKNPEWHQVMGIISWLGGEDAIANQHFFDAAKLRNAAADISKAGVSTYYPYEVLDLSEATFSPYASAVVQAELSSLDGLASHPFPGLLATVADSKYFIRYGEPYTKSLRKHDPDLPLLFHVMDLNDPARALFAKLQSRYGNLFLSSETAVYPRPFYYASVRLLRAYDIVSQAKRPVFFTDIDATFRTPTEPVFAYGQPFDLMLRMYDQPRLFGMQNKNVIMRYPKLEPWGSVNAAALLFAPTETGFKTLDFARKLTAAFITKSAGQNSTNWWIDQNVLCQFKRWLSTVDGLRLGNFEDVCIPYSCFSHIELSDTDKLRAWRQHYFQAQQG